MVNFCFNLFRLLHKLLKKKTRLTLLERHIRCFLKIFILFQPETLKTLCSSSCFHLTDHCASVSRKLRSLPGSYSTVGFFLKHIIIHKKKAFIKILLIFSGHWNNSTCFAFSNCVCSTDDVHTLVTQPHCWDAV